MNDCNQLSVKNLQVLPYICLITPYGSYADLELHIRRISWAHKHLSDAVHLPVGALGLILRPKLQLLLLLLKVDQVPLVLETSLPPLPELQKQRHCIAYNPQKSFLSALTLIRLYYIGVEAEVSDSSNSVDEKGL